MAFFGADNGLCFANSVVAAPINFYNSMAPFFFRSRNLRFSGAGSCNRDKKCRDDDRDDNGDIVVCEV